MLVPSRNQRPVRPTFRHWQTPNGSSQMVQTRPAALSGPAGDLRRGGRPEAAAFAAAAGPGACAPGLGDVAVWALASGVRANVALAESPMTFWATATAVTPG